MSRIYKIGETPVLNSFELAQKDVFKPYAILEKLNDFITFAEVHCAPLQKVYMNKNGARMQAVYLTKTDLYGTHGFWFGILDRQELPKADDAVECFDKLCEEKFGFSRRSNAESKTKKAVTEEITCFEIDEKLDHICKSAPQDSLADFAPTAVKLLAICEIADVDARDFSFEKSKTRVNNSISISYIQNTPNPLKLTARPEPYKFYYHDSDELTEGEQIETIKIKAVKGKNIFDKLKISLYSEKSGELLHTYSIEIGGYRYINASGGKIIKFLPTISVGNDICVYREGYTDPGFYMKTANGVSEIKLADAENVSSFSVSQTERAVLFVINGKPVPQDLRYKNDPYLTNGKDIVEAKLVDDGFALLHCSGTVFSSLEQYHLKKTASLDKSGRLPMPSAGEPDGTVSEVVCSDDGKTIAVKTESNGQNLNGKIIIKSV